MCNEIAACQYNAALAITCDMTGSLKETLYQKLGLEYLGLQRWFLPCKFYKIVKVKSSWVSLSIYLAKWLCLPNSTVIASNNFFVDWNISLIFFFLIQWQSVKLNFEKRNSKSDSYIIFFAQMYQNDSNSVINITDSYDMILKILLVCFDLTV